ncbi:hypothetical protein [Methyloglobulus sp.]|uniref:hypothetical protein n=1 Tax=Methyloglobulus sp. TaxID=2518622 RepID=UPI0032B7AEF9
MNIYHANGLCLAALFFTVSCQSIAVLPPAAANEVLAEIAQVTNPKSKIHVATSISSIPVELNAIGFEWEEYRCGEGSIECELGTLKLGNDHCFYVELDNGVKVLPVLISEYLPPDKLAVKYTRWLGRKVMGYYGNQAIDLKSTVYNTTNIGWVTPPPQLECKLSQAHQYARLILNDKYTKFDPLTGQDNLKPSPPIVGKLPYMGVFNYGDGLDSNNIKDAFKEGSLLIEKDCLYIRFKDGNAVLPIFETQRTFWQEAKNTLRASGKDWHLETNYVFGPLSDVFPYTFNPTHPTARPKEIVSAHPSCNTQQVRSVGGIYEPAEFKQKKAAYMAEEKAEVATTKAEKGNRQK